MLSSLSPSSYRRDQLEQKILANGGVTLSDGNLQQAILRKQTMNTLVIACPTGYRRPNFIFALAAGPLNRILDLTHSTSLLSLCLSLSLSLPLSVSCPLWLVVKAL
jgi:hypothetical protein